jgi:ADP-heptose:LPS heptosyltransferase
MTRILVVRLSAMGDVAMTIPVISSFATQYPDCQITVLTRKSFLPLFFNLPSNVKFIGVDFKDEYKGISGILKLARRLEAEKFDYVVDLHSVLRTILIRLYLGLFGAKSASIDKGRREKKLLTRRYNKDLKPLKSSFDRYSDVFQRLGFTFDYTFTSIFSNNHLKDITFLTDQWEVKGTNQWVGIAPFAKHEGKILPLMHTEKLIEYLSNKHHLKILLFGGGSSEKQITEKWQTQFKNTFSLTGKFNLEQELLIISNLDLMVSMDSANMHLASLVNVPVVSIWGATHPYAGFLGWKQSENNIIQSDIQCRPCSVYGQKVCYRGDYACMNNLDLRSITNVIEFNLRKHD